MATVTRADNTEFIAQPYREQLSIRNYNILKREVQHLAQVNGQFVRLFKLTSGNYEAVFSHDPGFLLGESVWHYFGKPDNLLYCEELNKDEVLLVLVRSGAVFLDGKYSKSAIKDELSLLTNASEAFMVKTYGNVPLAFAVEDAEPADFLFDPLLVRTHKELSKSVFNDLPAKTGLQLLSLEQALLEFRSRWPAAITVLILAVVVGFAGLMYSKKVAQQKVEQTVQDPYLNFRAALSTPSPAMQLKGLANEITDTYTIPGWVVTRVSTGGTNTRFQVNSLGGTLNTLFLWARQNNSQVNLGSTGATLQMIKALPRRASPTTIVDTKLVTAKVIDDMLQLLPGRSVKVNDFKSEGAYRESVLTISVSDITPNILSLIGYQLQGLPVKLDNVALTVNQGLLSGSIKLAILGN